MGLAAAEQKGHEAVDGTAKAVSRAMLAAFVSLALGALFAWFGGTLGQARRLDA